MMSRSANTCSTWLRSTRFCLLIFFMAKRCRLSRWRTKYTAPYAPLLMSLMVSKSSSQGVLAGAFFSSGTESSWSAVSSAARSAKGSLLRPSLPMMYWGMSVETPCTTLA
uniref:Uncharacterized protein n=1 Tax=Ixodes ricinus TaxID=34613 RepID=A0A6B0UIY6_IXORI